MRVTEDLIRQNKLKKQQQIRRSEGEEPTLQYKESTWEYTAINQSRTVFDSCLDKGINSGESVFDRKAVFRTKEFNR